MPNARILAFSGSTKSGSVNEQALTIAVDGAESAGAMVTRIKLTDFSMPLMNEDLEAKDGPPEQVLRLKALFESHDGMLIACPEYNSSITPLLKNSIDWVSRADTGGPGSRYFTGKTVGLVSAAPGALGGLRGLVHVRAILGSLGMVVIPEQAALPFAAKAFDADGNLIDDSQKARLHSVGTALAEVTAKLIS